MAAWKVSRLARLSKMRIKRAIGPKLHARATRATTQLTSVNDGVALAFMAFKDDNEDDERELALCLHSLLASDPAIGEDPANY